MNKKDFCDEQMTPSAETFARCLADFFHEEIDRSVVEKDLKKYCDLYVEDAITDILNIIEKERRCEKEFCN